MIVAGDMVDEMVHQGGETTNTYILQDGRALCLSLAHMSKILKPSDAHDARFCRRVLELLLWTKRAEFDTRPS